MNKSQAENKVYAFHAVFRVDVNDVKAPFSLSRFKMPVHPGLMIRDEP